MVIFSQKLMRRIQMKDYLKISLLIIIYFICLYSGIKTFFNQNWNNNLRQYTILPNYEYCKKQQQQHDFEECKQIITTAYSLGIKECQQYFTQFNICMKTSSSGCRTQKSNAERCAQVVIDNYLKSRGYDPDS